METHHGIELLPEEVFKPVPGYEGLYEVSTHGRVISVGRQITRQGKGDYWQGPKLLTPASDRNGYKMVSLCKQGCRKFMVNRLVALAHIGPPPSDKHQSHHLDNDNANNHVSNLVWVSPLENSHAKWQHGTMVRGEQINTAKLTESSIPEIYRDLNAGMTVRAVAEKYSISRRSLYFILQGVTWKHVDRPPLLNGYFRSK